jgi:uncharacterized membrane protein
MKLYIPLLLLFLGFAFTIFGALFKLESWEGASQMLFFGAVVFGLGHRFVDLSGSIFSQK